MNDGKGAIPPGIRLHLEERRRWMTQLGITREMVDGSLEAIRVGFLVDRFILETILASHRSDAWRARRRLKKRLAADNGAFWDHLRDCGTCRAAASAVGYQFLMFLLQLEKTAPT